MKEAQKNIVEEIRKALKSVCNENEEYILMPHSISGIYSLYYALEYPQEVKAIIGLDMTIAQLEDEKNINWGLFKEKTGMTKEEYYNSTKFPLLLSPLIKNTGVMRWCNNIYNKDDYKMLELYNLYTAEELKILKKEYNQYPSIALLNEFQNNTTNNNISYMNNAKLPENLPVLHFRASKPIEIKKEYLGQNSMLIINDTITNREIQKIEIVEGNHQTIFLEALNEIVEKTNRFIYNIN